MAPADVTRDALERLREVASVKTIRKTDTSTNVAGGKIAANRYLRLLRAAFNWAIDMDIVRGTPFQREGSGRRTIKLAKEKARSRRLQAGEEDRLLAACGVFLRGVVEAALETGMRRGEILGLLWGDVPLEPRAELHLPAAKTKTGQARSIPISSRLKAILEMRRDALRTALALPESENLSGTVTFAGKLAHAGWRAACPLLRFSDGLVMRTSARPARTSQRRPSASTKQCVGSKRQKGG